MADMNSVTTRKDNASMGSSFVEVTGELSIRTDATCSSTIREMLDVDRRLEAVMPPIHEEPPYSTPDDAFTELCATCLHRNGTRKEATHFCPGCDRRGRYMCGNCLKDHSVWCNKPEHEVQSLSVDRQSDPESCYHTIDQSERGRPNPDVPLQSNTKKEDVRSWLLHTSNDSDSENSEGTNTQSKGNGRNLNEHSTASTQDLSMSDGLSFDDTGTTQFRRPKTDRSISQKIEGQYENFTIRSHKTTSHIYCDPIEMLRLPRIPDPYRRKVHEANDWDHMSTATTRRLDDVYVHNEHNTQKRPVELAGWHKNEERDKKKKSCVIQ